MLNILIKTDSHFKVDRKRIRKVVQKVLEEKNIDTEAEVSLSAVGDRKMKYLNAKYRKIEDTTDVLSFPLMDEVKNSIFVNPPNRVLYLGDIVISYPQAVKEASDENKFVDEKIDELVEHGMLHLLGIHHD